MFEFGFGAMNGFCSAIVGSLSFFGVAGAPLNAGSDGVPASGIGTAWAVEAAAEHAGGGQRDQRTPDFQ